MSADLKFHGSEQIYQIFDGLMMAVEKLHQPIISVSTISGTYSGRIVTKGNQWLILEQKTSWHQPSNPEKGYIHNVAMIALNSIVAIQYEIMK